MFISKAFLRGVGSILNIWPTTTYLPQEQVAITPDPTAEPILTVEQVKPKARELSDIQESRLKAITAIFGGDQNEVISKITSIETLPSVNDKEATENWHSPEYKKFTSLGVLFTGYNGRYSSTLQHSIGVFVVNMLNDNENKIKDKDVMGFINEILSCRTWNIYHSVVYPYSDTGICF